ncbi:MAG TPA: trimethylamine methyltransferase family protein [Candidatus Latescibacteria bacterium]|nr:trimethylamine methyltransferase family protein [Candidatus Latescibacterota bacterium]HJP29306.1 trimethylamine methyltransferase family protein [Candidatus Latescibacterota bacterium]
MTHGFGSLQDTQAERIDALSLEILQRVGVGVDEALVRSRLAERGARVDEGAGRVYLTEDVLRGLLADAPADVRFGQRTGDTHTVGACAGGTVRWPGNALYLVDGAQRRTLTADDFARLTRLVDRLDNVQGMVGVSVGDFEPTVRDFCTLRLMAQHTGKHLRPVITSLSGVDAVMEMTDVLAAGRDDSPISFGYSVVSPLRWTATALQLIQRTSGRGLPFMFNAEPLAGGTSPVTLAGSLAQAHAETLSGIAIGQALEPGRPCLYNAGFAHTLDMKSAVALGGSAEVFLMATASADLARRWSLPCSSWVSSEGMTEDAQAAAEKSMGLTLHTQAGVNLVWGMGQLESQMSISLEQLVIDDEIAAQVDRLQRGITVDDEHLARQVLLADPAERGDLLAHEHTLRWFRQELDELPLANRTLRERWEETGSPDLRQRAIDRIAELLAEPGESSLTADEDAELLRIEQSFRRQLGG